MTALRSKSSLCLCKGIRKSLILILNHLKGRIITNYHSYRYNQYNLSVFESCTVPPKAAITSEWPSLSCVRFTYDIYARFFLLFLKDEEVENSLAICGGNLPWTRTFLQTVSSQQFSLENQSIDS